MIPKLVTAFISAAVLSAILGTPPCEATGADHIKGKAKKQPVAERSTGAADLNRPATDFGGVSPQIDAPDRDRVAPTQDKNQFFNQN